MTIYEKLESACLPFITAYKEDLTVHDRKSIDENPGCPFVHWTRAYGTQIVFLRPWDHSDWPTDGKVVPYLFGKATRSHILDQLNVIARYPFENLRCVHYFSRDILWGDTLDEISVAKGIEVVADYVRQVGHAWNANAKHSRKLEYA